MSPVPVQGLLPTAGRDLVALVAVTVLVASPGPLPAQIVTPKPGSSQDPLRRMAEDLDEAEKSSDPSVRRITRFFKSWVGLVLIATVVGAVGVLGVVVLKLYARVST